MFLQINDFMTVEEVEDRFHECFPFLMIAFYSKSHKKFEPTDNSYRYKPRMRIGDIRRQHYNGLLEIKSWYTTSKVEKELKQLFDLNAQIFRFDNRGNPVQTTLSDELTLQQQSNFSYDPMLNR